jgi:LysM repeat protein
MGIMLKHLINIVFLFFIGLSTIWAQDAFVPVPIVKSTQIIQENGKKYFVHKVEKGQTLYSISKAYESPVKDILSENPAAEEGIKPEMILRIPIVKDKKSNSRIDESGKFFLHSIEKKQTLYAIAKKYNIDEDLILKANPDKNFSALTVGDILKIPQKEVKEIAPLVVEKVPAPPVETEPLGNGTIAINLFLPLYLSENDSILKMEGYSKDDELFPKSQPAIEFLAGFKTACDSMAKKGLQIKLNVLDVPVDSILSEKYFATEKINPAPMWVGPFHSHVVASAAKAAKKNGASLVIPLAQQPKLLLGHPEAFKVTPSLNSEMEELCGFFFSQKVKRNFILIHNNLSKEKALAEIIKKKSKSFLANTDSVQEMIYKTSGSKGITKLIQPEKENVIFVPSNDQAFVTDLINKLIGLPEETKIILVGLEPWLNYENLDVGVLQRLNLHVASGSFTDYSKPETIRLLQLFREHYSTDPSKFAISGYDCGIYFIENYYNITRPNKEKITDLPKKSMIQTNFSFVKTSPESGFENKGIHVLSIRDYVLINAALKE